MSLWQAAVLAVIQGITEFLPISSSAHLALAPWLFGWKDQGLTFDIALHIGTLAAVVIYFLRDWVEIAARGLGLRRGGEGELASNPRLLWLLALGSVPVGVAGLAIKEYTETTLRSPLVMGTMLIAIAGVMAAADRAGRRARDIGSIGAADAALIGCAQAIALVPGTSRSGITIAAGLFRGLDRRAAARFSFLLSTPAVAAAAAKALHDLHKAGGVPAGLMPHFVLGIAVSGVTGCLAISFLLRYLARFSLRAFVYYRLVFGIMVIALALLLG
jgi:undecaprenyl-diphosphatase